MNKPRSVSLGSGLTVALLFAVSEKGQPGWISGSDWTIIAVLALFLIATEGLRESGYLERVVRFAADREIGNGPLFAILTFCSALLAAAATNDVSLFVIVPITVGICRSRRTGAGVLVVLEGMAANVGSAAMPWGNPQNIFLFHRYSMTAGAFYRLMFPPCAAMLGLLCFAAARRGRAQARVGRPEEPEARSKDTRPGSISHVSGVVFSVLLLLAVLQVLHLLPVSAGLLVLGSSAAALLVRWTVLAEADWTLLLLFAAIFLAIHGLEQSALMEWVHSAFGGRNTARIFVAAAGMSQVVSNVPAALLAAGSDHSPVGLHHATLDPRSAALLLGVNVGGLGTPVASLANLIAARVFQRSGGSSREFYESYWRLNGVGLAVYAVLGYTALRLAG